MNIFGVGSWELLVILVIALVIAGPKRMLQWAYYAGRVMAQVKVLWSQAMDSIQQELDQTGVNVKMPKDFTRKEIGRSASEFMKPFTDEVRKAEDEYRSRIKEVEDAYNNEVKELDSGIKASMAGALDSGTAANGKDKSKSSPRTTGSAQNTSKGFGTWGGSTAGKADNSSSSAQDTNGDYGNWSGKPKDTE